MLEKMQRDVSRISNPVIMGWFIEILLVGMSEDLCTSYRKSLHLAGQLWRSLGSNRAGVCRDFQYLLHYILRPECEVDWVNVNNILFITAGFIQGVWVNTFKKKMCKTRDTNGILFNTHGTLNEREKVVHASSCTNVTGYGCYHLIFVCSFTFFFCLFCLD